MVKVIIPDSQDSQAPGPGNIISSPTNDPPSQLDDISLPRSQDSYLHFQESYIESLPQVASVTVVYRLFLQVLPLLADGGRWNGTSSEWRLLETDPNDPALDIDLQGYKKYSAHETGGVLILNHPHFLDFAARAYNATPHDIKLSVIMDAPVNERVTPGIGKELGKSAIHPIEVDSIASGTTHNSNMFVTPPNHARSYTLRPPVANPKSSPDCEFLDRCTGRTKAAYCTLDHLGDEITNNNISLKRCRDCENEDMSDGSQTHNLSLELRHMLECCLYQLG
ncbi:hypothetical protein PCASD_16626 [Puccinia coronata f. sp. avenae]|uniref:Uncharacterized protein n=1 Tax=Puccinia coronata f. sp. avenae TaxID=200324 RepID=A0A2N5T3P3_9BASI|nr:hypothetical protein PCASD_16626 [Puccinia coronata f. sp. avenae]